MQQRKTKQQQYRDGKREKKKKSLEQRRADARHKADCKMIEILTGKVFDYKERLREAEEDHKGTAEVY